MRAGIELKLDPTVVLVRVIVRSAPDDVVAEAPANGLNPAGDCGRKRRHHLLDGRCSL